MDFKNKNILVIGGSSGIGRGIADCFKKYNANVCILALENLLMTMKKT